MTIATASMPIGIVVRRTPGVTRWAKWAWTVSGILPGAGPADWQLLRRDGEAVEYHACTLPLVLYSSDTEAYLVTLSGATPGLIVVLREAGGAADRPWQPHLVTASAYDGQDYMDSGASLVAYVPMPAALAGWVQAFCDRHHVDEVFVKRKRDRKRVDLVEDGRGDPRIAQAGDVYRAPRPARRRDPGGHDV
ncbi:DUF3305 domain-containing protein [Paracoccus jiaweipingae]|uniref:DUF3305 domain-containing protein n=1 Tax=unclassified Paracoccus (in: a-proteobacteria) TaxID=2688777 RepID=UPI0037984D0F